MLLAPSLQADLRALHAFISKKALLEEFEANGGEVHVIRPIDVHATDYVRHTKSYWREKELALEKKLREIMPIEPEKAKFKSEKDEMKGEMGGEDGDEEEEEEEKKEGKEGVSLAGQKVIKANQILDLYELRQGLMYR